MDASPSGLFILRRLTGGSLQVSSGTNACATGDVLTTGNFGAVTALETGGDLAGGINGAFGVALRLIPDDSSIAAGLTAGDFVAVVFVTGVIIEPVVLIGGFVSAAVVDLGLGDCDVAYFGFVVCDLSVFLVVVWDDSAFSGVVLAGAFAVDAAFWSVVLVVAAVFMFVVLFIAAGFLFVVAASFLGVGTFMGVVLGDFSLLVFLAAAGDFFGEFAACVAAFFGVVTFLGVVCLSELGAFLAISAADSLRLLRLRDCRVGVRD